MSEIKWIKIVVDIFDDEKILLIESLPEADSIIVIWFKLLCLAGKQNNSGVFIMNNQMPYTDKMLATIFRRNENTVKLALETFKNFGMIEIIDNVITIPNWEKHQQLDQLELARKQTRKRVAKYREKQKILVNGNDNCNVTTGVTVTESNADRLDKDKNRIDKNIEENKIIEIYNFNCTKLPKVQKLTEKRKKSIKTFLKEFSVEQFEDICKIANSSDFLTGNKGEGWRADFDFLMRVDKATSVLEGKYNSNSKNNKVPIEQKFEYKEVEMTEEEYIQKLQNGGKKYV